MAARMLVFPRAPTHRQTNWPNQSRGALAVRARGDAQHSTGGKQVLGKTSKMGQRDIRRTGRPAETVCRLRIAGKREE
jgi:hypothetical protein